MAETVIGCPRCNGTGVESTTRRELHPFVVRNADGSYGPTNVCITCFGHKTITVTESPTDWHGQQEKP